MPDWLISDADALLRVVISAVLTYAAILALTRMTGLRSFSKMSASDFAMTVAVGSLFASTTAQDEPSVLVGVTALACLFAGQGLIAWSRRRSGRVSWLVDNQPLLLMRGTEILEHNMEHANVTHEDLFAKLREANVLDPRQVRAVIFETTGDVSVLHANDPDAHLDEALLLGVQEDIST